MPVPRTDSEHVGRSHAWGLAFSVAFHALLFSPQLAEWAWRKDSPDAGAKNPAKAPDAAKDRPQPKQTTPDPAHGPKEQPPKPEEHSPEAKAAQPPPPAPAPNPAAEMPPEIGRAHV